MHYYKNANNSSIMGHQRVVSVKLKKKRICSYTAFDEVNLWYKIVNDLKYGSEYTLSLLKLGLQKIRNFGKISNFSWQALSKILGISENFAIFYDQPSPEN